MYFATIFGKATQRKAGWTFTNMGGSHIVIISKSWSNVLSFLLLTFPPLFLKKNLKFQKKMAETPAFPFINIVIHIN
jgi:hypothetical protein